MNLAMNTSITPPRIQKHYRPLWDRVPFVLHLGRRLPRHGQR